MSIAVKPPTQATPGAASPAPAVPAELAEPPAGAQLLDVRPVEAFAKGHHAGALNVPVSGTRFSTKAAFVLDPAAQVVVSAGSQDEVDEAVRGLRSVGYLDVAGYVLGGGQERLPLVPVSELDQLLADGAELIDVREKDERDAKLSEVNEAFGSSASARHWARLLLGFQVKGECSRRKANVDRHVAGLQGERSSGLGLPQ